MAILYFLIGAAIAIVIIMIAERLDYGIFCESCGAKKIKKRLGLYNEYTGRQRYMYACPTCKKD